MRNSSGQGDRYSIKTPEFSQKHDCVSVDVATGGADEMIESECRMDIHVRRMTMKLSRSENFLSWQSFAFATVTRQYLGHEYHGYRSEVNLPT